MQRTDFSEGPAGPSSVSCCLSQAVLLPGSPKVCGTGGCGMCGCACCLAVGLQLRAAPQGRRSLIVGTAWSSCCQPLLATTHGDSSPLPLVWTLCFRSCSQTVFKGVLVAVGCGKQLWEWELQLWCMVCSRLCCEHSMAVTGARFGLCSSSPILFLDKPVSNLTLSSDPLEPSHGHVVARADAWCQHRV